MKFQDDISNKRTYIRTPHAQADTNLLSNSFKVGSIDHKVTFGFFQYIWHQIKFYFNTCLQLNRIARNLSSGILIMFDTEDG